jgi:hypothetical protein
MDLPGGGNTGGPEITTDSLYINHNLGSTDIQVIGYIDMRGSEEARERHIAEINQFEEKYRTYIIDENTVRIYANPTGWSGSYVEFPTKFLVIKYFNATDTNTDTNTDTDTDTSTDTTTSQTGGIKISELDKITNFDPADLMIISRDEDNNGTYDKSFAIDPTLLRDSARSNIGTEKPSDPKNGEFWFDENTANLYIYTEALNSWIQVGT